MLPKPNNSPRLLANRHLPEPFDRASPLLWDLPNCLEEPQSDAVGVPGCAHPTKAMPKNTKKHSCSPGQTGVVLVLGSIPQQELITHAWSSAALVVLTLWVNRFRCLLGLGWNLGLHGSGGGWQLTSERTKTKT